MRRLTDKRKYQFENRIESLLDTFLLISREIQSEGIWIDDNNYLLKKKAVSVKLSIVDESATCRERLVIIQQWPDDKVEQITYESHLENDVSYSIRELGFLSEKFETSPNFLQEINEIQANNSLQIFKDKAEFLAKVDFIQLPYTSLTYYTSDIGRGMHTLASLCIPSTPNNQADQVIGMIFDKMYLEREVQKVLKRRYGSTNIKQHIKMIRAGKVNCSKEFQLTLEDTVPPEVLGYRLVDICKVYSKKKNSINDAGM